MVGVKKAKEIWFLCRQYDAQQALDMGLVNTVVPLERLEEETVQWCREMLALSPFSLRLLKASFNAAEDGLAGIQQLAHDANLLFYGSEEAKEGREAYKQKRQPDFDQFPRRAMTTIGTSRRAHADCGDAHPKASSAVHIWLMAARPRTLPAAVAPVLVGTSLALGAGHFRPLAFLAALLGAIFIQVGTNLSNDYSDARRGADTEDRLGPVRVTAGGLVPPGRVLLATYVTFGLAVLCGVYLVVVAGWELIAVGGAVDPGRRALHRRPAALRLRGPGRAVRVPLLRDRGRDRLLLRAGAAAALAGVRLRGTRRAAGKRDPRRQQRARPGDRPARGQAHACGAPWARAHAHALHGDGRGRVRARTAALAARLDERLAFAAVACDPTCDPARARPSAPAWTAPR